VQDLQIEVERFDGPSIVRLAGELGMATAPRVRATLRALADGDGDFALNLADVTFIDSAGLHLLVDAAKEFTGAGPLTLLDVPPEVLRPMELVGLSELASLRIERRAE
jgi:anti-anti-sigma factor